MCYQKCVKKATNLFNECRSCLPFIKSWSCNSQFHFSKFITFKYVSLFSPSHIYSLYLFNSTQISQVTESISKHKWQPFVIPPVTIQAQLMYVDFVELILSSALTTKFVKLLELIDDNVRTSIKYGLNTLGYRLTLCLI